MKTSFPYMRISQKHGIPYTTVLNAVQYYKDKGSLIIIPEGSQIHYDILSVINQHKKLVSGERAYADGYYLPS